MIPKNFEILNSIKQFKNQTSNKVPEGEIKTWNPGKQVITGSAGLLGVIGGGGLKLLSKGAKVASNLFSKSSKVTVKSVPIATTSSAVKSSGPLIINNKIIKEMPTAAESTKWATRLKTKRKPVSNYTYHGPKRTGSSNTW